MITSSAPGHTLDKLRRLAGPNPEDSKLTDVERLHLIFLLGAVINADAFSADVHAWITKFTFDQLAERGFSRSDYNALFDRGTKYTPVDVANMIAVHPKFRDNDYLD